MKKLTAHFLFPGHSSPIKNGIVELEESGKISGITDPGDNFREIASLEFHNGIICPDFVILLRDYTFKEFFSFFPELSKYEILVTGKPTNDNRILEWMKAIMEEDKIVTLEYLINIFTIKSAKIINKQEELGSLEYGKLPGLLLINNMDYSNLRLTSNSKLKKLV